LGDWPRAEAHFEHALVLDEQSGAQPWLCLTRYQFGRALLARSEPSAHERARALLEAAQAATLEMGMSGLVERIRAAGDSRRGVE
jgi:hypothetical protein